MRCCCVTAVRLLCIVASAVRLAVSILCGLPTPLFGGLRADRVKRYLTAVLAGMGLVTGLQKMFDRAPDVVFCVK